MEIVIFLKTLFSLLLIGFSNQGNIFETLDNKIDLLKRKIQNDIDGIKYEILDLRTVLDIEKASRADITINAEDEILEKIKDFGGSDLIKSKIEEQNMLLLDISHNFSDFKNERDKQKDAIQWLETASKEWNQTAQDCKARSAMFEETINNFMKVMRNAFRDEKEEYKESVKNNVKISMDMSDSDVLKRMHKEVADTKDAIERQMEMAVAIDDRIKQIGMNMTNYKIEISETVKNCCDKQLSEDTLPDNFLLFTDSLQGNIIRMDLDSQTYMIISAFNRNPVAIDYDYANGRVYWTDVVLKQIRSVSIKGTSETVIKLLDRVAIPDGLAVDSISGLIFYTDTGNDIIAVMTLDGTISAVIVSSDLDQPRAIVADPIKAKLYWSDWGAVPKIEMSNYDGTSRQTIIAGSGMKWPNALALDDKDGVIYWLDAGTSTIEKINLDGSDRRILYREILTHYFGIALGMNTLYYTDWTERTVMSISTTGFNKTRVGPPEFLRLSDIHMHNSAYIPRSTNGCAKDKGGCSHICIPVAGGSRKCVCPTAMSLQPNGITCI